MQIKDLDLPVPYHPTFDIHDPSKVQSFTDCPRGYFFSYVLGWRRDESNIHLVFGSAWHEAMEHLYNNGLNMKEVDIAFQKFLEIYREGFPNDITDKERAPKNPEHVLKGLVKYVTEYRSYDKDIEVLYTEVAGTVPIREDRLIHTKTDVVLRDVDGIWSHEHKTTGRNSEPWRNKWELILQVGTYAHLLNASFPNEHVEGVKINGAVFTKSRGVEFMRIPVRKTPLDMQQYLWEINHWMDQIEWNFIELSKCSPDDDVMTAFPKNAQSCSKFGCKYPGLCSAWQNPLKRCSQPPPGYKVEWWDPRRENEEKSNFVAKPDEKGEIHITKKEKQEQKTEEDNVQLDS